MPIQRKYLLLTALWLTLLACSLTGISTPPPGSETPPLSQTIPASRASSTPAESIPSQVHPTATAEIASGDPCPQVYESMDAIMSSCPTTCELAWFDHDFDIVFDDAAGLPAYACQDGLDPDGGVNQRLAVYQALRAMAALSFDQPLPWTDLDLYAWLRNAIDGIRLTTTLVSYCCDPQNRIVLKADLLSQPSQAFWYDPQYGIGVANLVGLIVHEARHAEIGGHTCGHDDLTLDELGAWGVQYYYFTWLAEHTPAGVLTLVQIQAAQYDAQVALSRICNP
ncbi:MAG TPA: hypothetical protein G4O08_10700 [Anaerolineae bacterium]|nr:hypothetical protein [Anaerolineae bacterium]